MRTRINPLVIACLFTLFLLSPTKGSADSSSDIPIKKAILYSSGVGYFEHFGSVEGSAESKLLFKTEQINDLLKSLVLQDLDGGKIGTVVYPSRDPISKTLRSFQVDLSANTELTDLLGQLRGAKVTVNAGAETVEGTILGLERRPAALAQDAPPVEVPVLNLYANGTIRSVFLKDILSLELNDAELQDELDKALGVIAGSRDQNKKPITIHFNGEGERRVRFGYLIETPVWKTSYRLILSEEGNEAHLQGWAIVENQTDNDWDDVELSLVSGRPISFVQDLYQPLYVPRPVVQPELYRSLRPERYREGVDQVGQGPARRRGRVASKGRALGGGLGGGLGMVEEMGERPSSSEQAAGNSVLNLDDYVVDPNNRDAASGAQRPLTWTKSESDFDITSSVASTAAAGKLGELFEYNVGAISLPRQRSAMIPIVTDPIEAERVSIYNQNKLATNPLLGARLSNTTGKHLLQGPITVFDGGAYSGDAQIDSIPPDQERLISFAVDLQVRVQAEDGRNENHITTGRIDRGTLHVTRKRVISKEYSVVNDGDKDRTVLIEHPLRSDWDLTDTPAPEEKTESLYRFRVDVPADSTSTLVVNEERTDLQTIALLPSDIGNLDFYSKTGEIPQNVRSALVQAMNLKRAISDTEREINERRQKIAQITEEQRRIRENMNTVRAQQNQYYARLLKKLDDQETTIEQLQLEIDDLESELDSRRKALQDYLKDLTIG